VQILAFTEGLKTFKDINNNNIFDSKDELTDMGDAFRDDNENGVFDDGEFVLSRKPSYTNGSCGTGSLNKVWGTPSKEGTCDSQTAEATVRSQITLLMATGEANLTVQSNSPSAVSFFINSTTDCKDPISGRTSKCLPMASGTTLTAATSNPEECTAAPPIPSIVGNIRPNGVLTTQLGSYHTVLLTAAKDKSCLGKDLYVTTTSFPSKFETTFSIRIGN
jgi:hypothetical protein